MTFVLVMLSALAAWQYDFVKSAVEANVFLNATIIGVFLFGCYLLYRYSFGLFNETLAMEALRSDYAVSNIDPKHLYAKPAKIYRQPVILSHAYSLLHEEIQSTGHLAIGTATMQNLVDGVEVRLDDQKSLIQYVTGLLVFLGLIGTFVGLMQTVSSVGEIIGSLNFDSDVDVTETVAELIASLKGPLVGMGTGFSSSLFGLVTSLALGLMGRFGSAAANGFKSAFESWLAGVAKLESVMEQGENALTPVVQPTESGPADVDDLSVGIDKIVSRMEELIAGVAELSSKQDQPVTVSERNGDRRVRKAERLIVSELQKLNDAVRADTVWRRQLEERIGKIASNAEADRELLKTQLDQLAHIQFEPEAIAASTTLAPAHSSSSGWGFLSRFNMRTAATATPSQSALVTAVGRREFKEIASVLRALDDKSLKKTQSDKQEWALTQSLLVDLQKGASDILHQMEKQEESNREFMFIMTELRRDRRDQHEERRAMRQNLLASEKRIWKMSDDVKKSTKRLEALVNA